MCKGGRPSLFPIIQIQSLGHHHPLRPSRPPHYVCTTIVPQSTFSVYEEVYSVVCRAGSPLCGFLGQSLWGRRSKIELDALMSRMPHPSFSPKLCLLFYAPSKITSQQSLCPALRLKDKKHPLMPTSRREGQSWKAFLLSTFISGWQPFQDCGCSALERTQCLVWVVVLCSTMFIFAFCSVFKLCKRREWLGRGSHSWAYD